MGVQVFTTAVNTATDVAVDVCVTVAVDVVRDVAVGAGPAVVVRAVTPKHEQADR